MRRRAFIGLLGGAAAWPLVARAQQRPLPVIGFVNTGSREDRRDELQGFLRGLGETGYVEGQSVVIEYRWAEGRIDRLPVMLADLVDRKVSVIAATTTAAALAAQVATTTIPIVFETGSNPIQLGLVVSLNRPGGNLTGATSLIVEVLPKRLELLHELLPTAKVMGLLVNPDDRNLAQTQSREVLSAARNLGLELHVVNVSSEREFEGAFAKMRQLQVRGLVIGAGSLFIRSIEQLATLTVRHALPAIYQYRSFPAAGGLMSYGADVMDAYRWAGVYTGRVLRGENPGDLPVQQATKFDLHLNLKTAKALGLTIPATLLGRADEVIE
jgi:putative ABC transport system substrate-binding protein